MRMAADLDRSGRQGETMGMILDQESGQALALTNGDPQAQAWQTLNDLECAALGCDWMMGRVELTVCPTRRSFLDSACEMNALTLLCQRRMTRRLNYRRHVQCLARCHQ